MKNRLAQLRSPVVAYSFVDVTKRQRFSSSCASATFTRLRPRHPCGPRSRDVPETVTPCSPWWTRSRCLMALDGFRWSAHAPLDLWLPKSFPVADWPLTSDTEL